MAKGFTHSVSSCPKATPDLWAGRLYHRPIYSFILPVRITAVLILLVIALPSLTFPKTDPCLHWIKETDSLLLADPRGQIILSRHTLAPRVPASTLKLLTSLAAIHELGTHYRFKTEFYLDTDGVLYIKGLGDPLLISEVVSQMANQLRSRVGRITAIVTDNSYFSNSIKIPGAGHSTNPYDAIPAALCVNFNTIMVARDTKGNIISGEPQTPLTPLAVKIASQIGAKTGRYTIGQDPDLAAHYAGELIREFLIRSGVNVQGNIRSGIVGSNAHLVFTHYCPFTLEDIIQKMLEYSSNFIANQLLITMGAHRFGPPGTLEKGLKVVQRYVDKELGLKSAVMVEGSGISRKNRIAAADMLKVLRTFMPYHELLRHKGQVFYKTGTLSDVRTCVGYIQFGPKGLYPFVIFINRPFRQLHSLIQCIEKVLR